MEQAQKRDCSHYNSLLPLASIADYSKLAYAANRVLRIAGGVARASVEYLVSRRNIYHTLERHLTSQSVLTLLKNNGFVGCKCKV